MSCLDLAHAPVAATARATATGPVSMSTRPDPEGSDTVEFLIQVCPRAVLLGGDISQAHIIRPTAIYIHTEVKR